MTKELIEEARQRAAIGADVDPIDAARLLNELADGLESAEVRLAARQPTEAEYMLKLIDTVKGTRSSVEIDGVKIMPCDEFGRTAAVPDAATETATAQMSRLNKAKRKAEAERDAARAEIESRIEDRDYWYGIADKAKSQRDAALAKIERVRAAHLKFTYYELEDSCPDTSEDHREERHRESDEIGEFYCEDMPTGDVVCDLCRDADGERMDWPCPTVAALDGAPEPEEKP